MTNSRADGRPSAPGLAIGSPGFWVALFGAGIVAAYLVVFAVFFNRVGLHDHDQFLVFHELQYWNVRLFGLAKQWCPLMAGGLSLAADPQVPIFSAGMLMAYVLGPFYGLRLATVAFFALGWLGAYAYGGIWSRRRSVRALGAALFIGNGFFVLRFAHGHMDHIPFLILPWFLWCLHRLADAPGGGGKRFRRIGIGVVALAMGAMTSVVVDGSPAAIIHLMLWVGVYAMALSIVRRRTAPILAFAGACAIALFLDAGYLWPMLAAQAEFPRRTPDMFTNPLVLLWFMILPGSGKVIPAPANGQEYSVFIGPVLAWMIWRYRAAIWGDLPREIRRPWMVTGLVALILGMGSLHALGVPRWLSPFDLVRDWPGFRSIGVTGRFWGFLALPLSMMAAMAFAAFIGKISWRRIRGWVAALAILVQLSFQVAHMAEPLATSRSYEAVSVDSCFRGGLEQVEYVFAGRETFQGELITPVRGVIDAYNMGDFIWPEMEGGARLIRWVALNGEPVSFGDRLTAGFETWSRIRLQADLPALPALPPGPQIATVVFNQAYNRHWRASAGDVSRRKEGNLVLQIPLADLRTQGVLLTFHDPISSRGVAISLAAWACWLPLLLAGLIVPRCLRNRPRLHAGGI